MQEIEQKREQMVTVGMERGLTHPLTVHLSQELDRLHNEQMQIQNYMKKAEAAKHVG
jgi:hypothetical protein